MKHAQPSLQRELTSLQTPGRFQAKACSVWDRISKYAVFFIIGANQQF